MKVIDLQYITHCTNDEYWLITIHGADDTLIHVKPSKTLQKQLLKQKDKAKTIKIGVNRVQQALLLPNGMWHWTSNLITNEIWKRTEEDGRDEWYTWKMTIWMMIHDDDRRDDMERWKMKNDKRHAKRHDIFPEDDILDIITISRYNYHK